MAETVKYGFKGKFYINSGTYASPTWNEVKRVKEVKVGAAFDKEDATTRMGGGIKQSEPVLLDIGLTGKVRSDEGDTTGFLAMETAFLTRAEIDVMVLDGDKATDGSRGYRIGMKVFKFEEDQDVAKILWRDFDLSPCVSENAPCKAVVSASAPVFTSLAA